MRAVKSWFRREKRPFDVPSCDGRLQFGRLGAHRTEVAQPRDEPRPMVSDQCNQEAGATGRAKLARRRKQFFPSLQVSRIGWRVRQCQPQISSWVTLAIFCHLDGRFARPFLPKKKKRRHELLCRLFYIGSLVMKKLEEPFPK